MRKRQLAERLPHRACSNNETKRLMTIDFAYEPRPNERGGELSTLGFSKPERCA